MAKVKALISFAGTELSMSQGETREISGDAATYWNRIGYVEIVSEQEPEKAPVVETPTEETPTEETPTEEAPAEEAPAEEAPKKEAKKNEGKRTKRTDS